jgi:hypothetical protein
LAAGGEGVGVSSRRSRRRLLAGTAALLGTLAGCTGPARESEDDDSGDDTDRTLTGETPVTTGDEATGTDDGSPAEQTATTANDGETTAASDDLDLREANVVGVAVEAQGGGDYRFDVTLIHDDDGEEGYANWWQVETLDGRRLGRRDLLHAHGTREFTRSETVSVPEGVERVVVRGHDQTHGYGGRAMVVTLATGETEVHRQGSDREPVA